MPKNLAKDEIDLIDILIVIWKKKFNVIFFILISFALVFLNQNIINKEPKKIRATTEISTISVYDEAKYKIYNSIINTIKPYYIAEDISKKIVGDNLQTDISFKSVNNKANNLHINNIDKKFLLDLFVDRINDKPNLKILIKKFNLIQEEDNLDKIEYEELINNLASSIKIIVIDDVNFIRIKTNNEIIKNWEIFLEFLEKEINLQIQKKLSEMFNNYVVYADAVNEFEIEDIETQLKVTTNEIQKSNLKRQLSILNANKYIDRIQSIFNSSPISNPNNFYAAKINYNLTSYKTDNNTSDRIMYLIAGILGAIIGIFFVLIANAIQKRT